jgi:hypothetical protein
VYHLPKNGLKTLACFHMVSISTPDAFLKFHSLYSQVSIYFSTSTISTCILLKSMSTCNNVSILFQTKWKFCGRRVSNYLTCLISLFVLHFSISQNVLIRHHGEIYLSFTFYKNLPLTYQRQISYSLFVGPHNKHNELKFKHKFRKHYCVATLQISVLSKIHGR